jgi:hypothetical protein
MPEIDEIGDLFKNFDSKTKPFWYERRRI